MWYLNRIYVQSNHFSHFCPEIIWSIEIHGDSYGLRTSYSVSRNLLSTFNRWILWKLCWDTLCLSILHRHVPETEFGTGSMKYLPLSRSKIIVSVAELDPLWQNFLDPRMKRINISIIRCKSDRLWSGVTLCWIRISSVSECVDQACRKMCLFIRAKWSLKRFFA